jgi:hypothetical protein
MNLTDELIEDLAQRVKTFAATHNSAKADADVTAKMGNHEWLGPTFNRHLQRGLSSADAMVASETTARIEWDTSAFAAGVATEAEVDWTLDEIQKLIAAARVLPSTMEALATPAARQTEELIALFSDDKYRARFQAMTRAEVKQLYEAVDPETQAGRRLLVWLEANFSTAQFRDDPAHDAASIQGMHAAIETKQLARVDPKLFAWRDRLTKERAGVNFRETMRHLRDGRGIARRPPKPMLVQAV